MTANVDGALVDAQSKLEQATNFLLEAAKQAGEECQLELQQLILQQISRLAELDYTLTGIRYSR